MPVQTYRARIMYVQTLYTKNKIFMNPMRLEKSYEDLNSNEFQQRMNGNADAVLLDVRTPSEFGESRIPKAINIDIIDSSFLQKISALDKTKT